MSARELASVSLKVMGIYWLVSSVLMVPSLLMMFRVSRVTENGVDVRPATLFLTQLVLLALLISIGLMLLLGTSRVLRLFFSAPQHTGAPLESPNLQGLAFSLFGAWLLISSVSALASATVSHFFILGMNDASQQAELLGGFWGVVVQSLFEAVVGGWLLMRARYTTPRHRPMRSA